jgi:hypothetical protein
VTLGYPRSSHGVSGASGSVIDADLAVKQLQTTSVSMERQIMRSRILESDSGYRLKERMKLDISNKETLMAKKQP